jgi:hypothetical protein
MIRITAFPLLALLVSCASDDGVVCEADAVEVQRPHVDLVRRFDAVVQEHFATVTGEDISMRRFGSTRIPIKQRHSRIFEPRTEAERDLVARLSASGWRSAVFSILGADGGFPHVAHGPVAVSGGAWTRADDRSIITRLGRDCAKDGRVHQGSDGTVALEARPVLASKEICLHCHDDRKLGAPMGAVIYAFARPESPIADEEK